MLDILKIKNYIKSTFTLFALILLFNGCKKSCDPDKRPDPTIYPVSAHDKAMICYNGLDTLTFTDKNGDTITFRGQGKKLSYIEKIWDNDNGCIIGIDDYERYYTIYRNPIGDDVIYYTYDALDQLNIEIYNNSKKYSAKFNFPIVALSGTTGDSLIFNNYAYYPIALFDSPGNYADTLYYHKQYGIVKIKLASGELFKILRK